MAVARTFIDGEEVTELVDEGSLTHRHNRPKVGRVRLPSELTSGDETSRVKVVLDGEIDAHGTVEGPAAIEDEGGVNDMSTTFEFASPMALLDFRRAMDLDGDYSKPEFIQDFVTGPQIVQQILANTLTQIGPLGIELGTFATGGTSLKGAPTNWPMMVSQVISLLTETGELDVVETPIDSGGNMSRIDCYNGDYGANLSGSVSFEYATGSFNAIGCRRTVDKSQLANRIRYLLGPKESTKSDPKAAQHWAASIDRTSLLLLPAKWTTNGEPARAQSELDHFIRENTRIFDARGDEATVGYLLYVAHWVAEAWLRLKPKTLVHLTPNPGIVPEFKCGDRIHVAAGPRFRGGFDGVQRVMEYTYRWDKNGVVELGAPVGQSAAAALVTTPDVDGLT